MASAEVESTASTQAAACETTLRAFAAQLQASYAAAVAAHPDARATAVDAFNRELRKVCDRNGFGWRP
jgi:hypothetical protein